MLQDATGGVAIVNGMQAPQLLLLKLANAIQIETDLTLARQ